MALGVSNNLCLENHGGTFWINKTGMPKSFGSDETLMKSNELPAPQKVQ